MPDEYISREAALKDFESCNAENPNWTPQRVKTLMIRQPAADVAEVVRCGYCCSRGEKKATMRLIDANAVYNEALENHQKGEIEDWEFDSIINYLDGAPTINTVEIVYCKDCKHKVRTDANGIVICSEEHGMYCPTENDFCRYGVKKGETPE